MTTESGKAADTMKFTEIDGVRIVHEFVVLWHEWECDGYGWVTEDGRVYLSTHGNIFEAPTSEVLERLEAALSCADGIRKALALATEAQENAETEPREAKWSTGTNTKTTRPQPDDGEKDKAAP